MPFNYVKPMEELEEYMLPDLDAIHAEFLKNGVIFDGQFKTLSHEVCNNNLMELTDLFFDKMDLDIWYEYDVTSDGFVFYDTEKYSREEALRLSLDYHRT